MNYRDLEAVRQIVHNATGLDITYAYEDLVFPEHVAFIIQFDEVSNNNLYCYFHQDCTPTDQESIFNRLTNECLKKKASIEKKNYFTLDQDGGNVQIKFCN
jgi:hypothetical protein